MDAQEEKIDLNKLTARELLIVVHNDVKELKGEMKTVKDAQHQTELKVNGIETRNKVWAGIIGFITGIAGIFAAK